MLSMVKNPSIPVVTTTFDQVFQMSNSPFSVPTLPSLYNQSQRELIGGMKKVQRMLLPLVSPEGLLIIMAIYQHT